jgi:ribosome-associated toxin RatA of RatAB toxin-antitoxin module
VPDQGGTLAANLPGRRSSRHWIPDMNRKLFFLGVFVALGVAGAVPASAAGGPEPERYERQTPLSEIKAGGSRAAVHAPIEVVRQIVTDFDGYTNYIKRFDKAKIIGRHGDKIDVYLQVPIMKGAAKVWAVVRFEPPRPTGNGEDVVIVGKLLKGNVKRLDAKYQISKIDDQNTKLDLELLIVPDFIVPVPNRLVAGEASWAASRAVLGIRNASEQRSR